LTLADYQEAWQPYFVRRSGRLPVWIVAVFAFGMAIMLLVRRDLFGDLFSSGLSGFFATMGVFLLLAPFLQKHSVATIWAGNPVLARPQTVMATPEAFQIQTEYSHNHISWRSDTRWSETTNLFCCFCRKRRFMLFPRVPLPTKNNSINFVPY
jgi:hypothetical protein